MARTKKEAPETVEAAQLALPVPTATHGTVDVATLPPLYPGMISRPSFVRLAQERLSAMGYYCPVTGSYDAATSAAVQRLQTANKIMPNGRVDAEVWRLLTA